MKRRGVIIPRKWPPGPKNPLGKYAMRITIPGYDIHGTNRDDGVGRRTSAGCVRMYNNDVAEVFNNVDIGTKVTIVNQPYKVGHKGGDILLEAHMPLYEQMNDAEYKPQNVAKAAVEAYLKTHPRAKIDWTKVKTVVADHSGLPSRIGTL
jgi:L,D-transpeptidase ErfK/SrfK